MQDVITVIGQLGFPIACAVTCMWYVKYSADKNREQISAMNEQHRIEMQDVTTAVNNNTIALNRLMERLGGSINENN